MADLGIINPCLFKVKINNKLNDLIAVDCIYINSIFSQQINLKFKNNTIKEIADQKPVKFILNMPSDETITETKIYF